MSSSVRPIFARSPLRLRMASRRPDCGEAAASTLTAESAVGFQQGLGDALVADQGGGRVIAEGEQLHALPAEQRRAFVAVLPEEAQDPGSLLRGVVRQAEPWDRPCAPLRPPGRRHAGPPRSRSAASELRRPPASPCR